MLQAVGIIIVFFFFFHFMNHDSLTLKNNTINLKIYQTAINNTNVYNKLPEIFKDKEIIVYNSRNFDKLKIMFHTDYRAKEGVPTTESIKLLKENNIEIVIFDDNKLPEYIMQDTTIAKIRSQVWQKGFEGEMEVYY